MKACLLLLLCGAAASAQFLEGDVVDRESGAPLAGTLLSVRLSQAEPPIETHADLGGHFRLAVPEAGAQRKLIYFSRAGYLGTSRPVPPQSSPDATNMKIALTPEAVIEGRVEDEDGFPAPIAVVQAGQFRMAGGVQRFVPTGMDPVSELGEFRITGLPAGSYYLQTWGISKLTDWDLRYSSEFYGGALTPEGAVKVTVKAGETLHGIDFHLRRREGVTVTARVTAPGYWGKPDRLSLSVVSDFDFSREGIRQSDGSYVFLHVSPGTYRLAGSAWFPALNRTVNAQQKVEVGSADVPGALLDFGIGAGVEVTGHVLLDGAPSRCLYAIGLRPGLRAPIGSRSRPDGSFAIAGVPPGHYALVVDGQEYGDSPACRTLTVSATASGKDVLHDGLDIGTVPAGLEIAMTAHVGTVEGKLVGASGKILSGGQLIFQQVTGERLFSTLAEMDGKFRRLLLPGPYYVFVALTSEQSQALADPAYRAQHRNDLPMIAVADGQIFNTTIAIPNR